MMMMKRDVNWFLGTGSRLGTEYSHIIRVLSEYLNNTGMIQIPVEFFTPLMMILIMIVTTMMMTMIMSNKWSAMLIALLCFFQIYHFGFVMKHKYKDQNE